MGSHSRIKSFVNLVVSTVLLIGALVVVFNRQAISDYVSFSTFSPTTQINTISDRIALTDHGKYIFYSSRPKFYNTSDFNSVCGRTENVTSILGCYADGKINIFDVTDSKLDGIREVTAAHEILHAAYARLGLSEREKIDKFLAIEYEKIKNDKDFSSRMAFYEKTEPDQIENELHSVIGTEVSGISEELEVYYRQYFVDRSLVYKLNQRYLSTFQELSDRAEKIKTDINNLVKKITDDSNQYNSDVNNLNNDISDFNNRASNGSFSSQSQFNYERSVLLGRVQSLETTRLNINNDIKTYESLLTEINSIATESKKLHNSIDSTLAPAPSI